MAARTQHSQTSATKDKHTRQGSVNCHLSISENDSDDDRNDSLHPYHLIDHAKVRASISAKPRADRRGSLLATMRRMEPLIGDGVCESKKELKLLGILPEIESDDELSSPNEAHQPVTFTVMLPEPALRPREVWCNVPQAFGALSMQIQRVGEWPPEDTPLTEVAFTFMLPEAQYGSEAVWFLVPPDPYCLFTQIEIAGNPMRVRVIPQQEEFVCDDEGYVSPTDTVSFDRHLPV